MDNIAGNSNRSKKEPEAREAIVPVTGEVITRKKSIFKRLGESFFAGRADNVGEYVLWDVMIPAMKDTFADMSSAFIDRMLFDGTRGNATRRNSRRSGSSDNRVSYNRMSANQPEPRGNNRMSPRNRQRHDFTELIFEHRADALEVLERMEERISKYHAVAVSDLYELCNQTANYTDNAWGWTNLFGSDVRRTGGGWILDLPAPEALE